MDCLEGIQHRETAEKWAEMGLCEQMGNIGSEVSRALRWFGTDKVARFEGAFGRALELFDLTIEVWRDNPARLREICRAREVFCDYFFDNEYQSSPEALMRYFDWFALMARADR